MAATNYTLRGLTYVGEPPSPYPATAITKVAWRNRFTFAERSVIKAAEATSIPLQVIADDVAQAIYIDLADPACAAGLDLLVTLTLITPARKAQILQTPIAASEKPLWS